MAAGVAVLVKQLMPEIKVIAVEPEDSSCLKAALDAGEPVVLDQVSMFADGVAVKRIGEETFRLCQKYIDGHIAVSSDEICAAVKPRRLRPIRLSPCKAARGPDASPNGITSAVTAVPPPIIEWLPIRTNGCTAALPPK